MKDSKFIETEHVFLDSSIFEEQNFTTGTKIHSLFYYAKEKAIKIHVTTISKKELFNRIEKRIIKSKSELKKLTKGFENKDTRIIKNLGFYKKIYAPTIDVRAHTIELKEKIEKLFSSSFVDTIPTKDIQLDEIVSNYYSQKPPFHNKGKQNEFIDAIILQTLENWCKKNNTKMYVLSKDEDFLGYKSDYLIIIDNISNLLEKISLYFDQSYNLKRVAQINKIIEQSTKDIEQQSEHLIREKVHLSSTNVDISDFDIKSNKIKSSKILTFRKNVTEVECLLKTELSFYIFEDDDFLEQMPKKIIHEFEIPIFIEIENNKVKNIKWVIEEMYLTYNE